MDGQRNMARIHVEIAIQTDRQHVKRCYTLSQFRVKVKTALSSNVKY
jgi:hypothetical protein